jgi:hypothetical protein
MNNMTYRFRLYVETPDRQEKISCFNVPAFVAEESGWIPQDVCDEPMTAFVMGGATRGMAARIDVEREKLARDISDQLTTHIMNSIKARDLRNGYAQSHPMAGERTQITNHKSPIT